MQGRTYIKRRKVDDIAIVSMQQIRVKRLLAKFDEMLEVLGEEHPHFLEYVQKAAKEDLAVLFEACACRGVLQKICQRNALITFWHDMLVSPQVMAMLTKIDCGSEFKQLSAHNAPSSLHLLQGYYWYIEAMSLLDSSDQDAVSEGNRFLHQSYDFGNLWAYIQLVKQAMLQLHNASEEVQGVAETASLLLSHHHMKPFGVSGFIVSAQLALRLAEYHLKWDHQPGAIVCVELAYSDLVIAQHLLGKMPVIENNVLLGHDATFLMAGQFKDLKTPTQSCEDFLEKNHVAREDVLKRHSDAVVRSNQLELEYCEQQRSVCGNSESDSLRL